MSNDVVVALITASAALAGVCISQLFELFKRASEEKRWYASYFLPRKFDAIARLYADTLTAYDAVGLYRYRKLDNDEEFQRLIVAHVNGLRASHHAASIYLDSKSEMSLSSLQQSLREAALHISSKIKDLIYDDNGTETVVVVDWPKELDAQFKTARNHVSALLTPQFLSDLEKRWK